MNKNTEMDIFILNKTLVAHLNEYATINWPYSV